MQNSGRNMPTQRYCIAIGFAEQLQNSHRLTPVIFIQIRNTSRKNERNCYQTAVKDKDKAIPLHHMMALKAPGS
jgi:hypothetical protein